MSNATEIDLPGADLTRLVEVLGTAVRNLSIRVGPNEYAMPTNRTVDLGVVLFEEVKALIVERMAQAWDEGASKASPHGGAFARSFYAENPYR